VYFPVGRVFFTHTRHKEPSNKTNLTTAIARASTLPDAKTELDKRTSRALRHGSPSQQAAGFGDPEVFSHSFVSGSMVHTQQGNGTGWKKKTLSNLDTCHKMFSKTKFIQKANVVLKSFSTVACTENSLITILRASDL